MAFLVLILLIMGAARVDTLASFKGNLLYVQQTDNFVTLNPTLINFHRAFNMKLIDICLESLDSFGQLYSDFCIQLHEQTKNMYNYTATRTGNQKQATGICLERDMILPEIRNIEEKEALFKVMKTAGVYKVLGGLQYNGQTLNYISDGTRSTITKYRSCEFCETKDIWDIQAFNKNNSPNWLRLWYYKLDDKNELVAFPEDEATRNLMYTLIICQTKPSVESTMLTTLARNACERDTKEINKTNEYLRKEAAQFYRPQRVKRGIAMALGAGFLGMETLNSMVTGGAPLGFMGKTMANIFGFATADDMRITKDQLNKHSKALQDLTINQQLLIEAHTKVTEDILQIRRLATNIQYDTAILFSDLNNKLAIYNLQSALQTTLLKMANAITAATQHNTSPYVFGFEDLRNLTVEYRSQNIPLTNDLNDVITTLALVENRYTFIFSAPLLNPANDFIFYEIRDLPIYHNDRQYKAEITHKFFALNQPKTEYVMVTQTEYYNCLKLMVCNVASPFVQVTNKSPCEILTLKYETQHCKLTETNENMDQFATIDNTTYYSLPEPTEIHISCFREAVQYTQHKAISGTGQITTQPGCQISAKEQIISIRPGYVRSRHNLEDNTFFEILKIPEKQWLIPSTTTQLPINITLPPFTFRDANTFKDSMSVIFNKDTTYAEAIRIICYISVIVTIFLSFYCCFPRCRLWFNGCCFIQKPTKYWRDVRKYQVPDFISQRRLNAAQITAPDPVDESTTPIFSPKTSPKLDKAATFRTQYDTMNPDMKVIESAPYPFNRLQNLYPPILLKTFKPRSETVNPV